MKVLVTGANGFVGAALCGSLAARGQAVRRALRRVSPAVEEEAWGSPAVSVGDLGPDTNWLAAVSGCEAVVHLAARVHVMNDRAADPLDEFRKVNVQGTLRLARQAAQAGVRRLVFVSSIKVNGEATRPGQAFHADDVAAPQDAYGLSKHEAELGLREIGRQTGMEVVVIRPPLVYGPGVRANFLALARAVKRGIPLPLGAIDNRRSLVSLDNLVDCIATCVSHPAAAHQTFLVSDGEDLSTTDLVRRMARAMGTSARLLPVPASWLEAGAALLGKRDVVRRLCGNLQVDIAKTQALLGWTPPVSVDEGLRRALVAANE